MTKRTKKGETSPNAMQPAAADSAQSKAPPAQEGDPKVEVAKAEAKPVLKSLDEGKADLDAHPERTSVLTEAGHLVRE